MDKTQNGKRQRNVEHETKPTMNEEIHFLKLEAENMALSLEAAGYGRHIGGKMCTPLERYRAKYPRGRISNWICDKCGFESPARDGAKCPNCRNSTLWKLESQISKKVQEQGGVPEARLRAKCTWEHMSRTAVIRRWGDPRKWKQ